MTTAAMGFDLARFCYGCGACVQACPRGALRLHGNREGFAVPMPITDRCTGCGRCRKVCIVRHPPAGAGGAAKAVWLYQNPDPAARWRSASGGAFYALGKAVLQQGGRVCGCVWNSAMEATHILSDRVEDLRRMQSSKYVQSDTGACFAQIQESLSAGHTVLFCGTPCQTAGLRNLLPQPLHATLLTVSLVCRGAPSPLIWREYRRMLEQQVGSALVAVDMRGKTGVPGQQPVCRYRFRNGRRLQTLTYLEDPYIGGFLYGLYTRRACSRCRLKGAHAVGDLLLGDAPDGLVDTSLVIALSGKGDAFLRAHLAEGLRPATGYRIGENAMLQRPAPAHPGREQFFRDCRRKGFLWAFHRHIPRRYYLKRLLHRLHCLQPAQQIYRKMQR